MSFSSPRTIIAALALAALASLPDAASAADDIGRATAITTSVTGTLDRQTIDLKTADIEERVPQRISVMPDKLADRMTLQELRDLIAFLDAQR